MMWNRSANRCHGSTPKYRGRSTFAIGEATVYNWVDQDKIDRGEREGLSTDQAIELVAAKRRIRQFETELAVARKVNEVFLSQELAPKASSR